MTIPINILATPDRVDKYVPHLVKHRLDNEPVTVILDEEMEGTWPTYKRGLETFLRDHPTETHLLQMHEDVVPCRDFLETVGYMTSIKPFSVLSFFQTLESVVNAARQKGTNWSCTYATFVQTLVWPVEIIWSFLEWDAKYYNYEEYAGQHEDQHTDAFWKFMEVEVWHPLPSLVEHIGVNDSSVNIPGKVFGKSRIAPWFIGMEESGLSVDWAATANSPHRVKPNKSNSRKYVLTEGRDEKYVLETSDNH